MRVICIGVIVLSALSMVAQAPPAHTYFDSPLIIEDGADIIDSTDYALPDTVPELFLTGNKSGNWYRIIGDGYYFTYFTKELLNSGAYTSRESNIVNGEIIPLSSWDDNLIIRMEPGLTKQYYLAPSSTTRRLIYRIRRNDYIPNNPYDHVEDAQCFNVNECVSASTKFSTPSEGASQSNSFTDDVDVYYKFTAISSAVFHEVGSPGIPKYEIYSDLNQSDSKRIHGERNANGLKYLVETDSTYYVRFRATDPFDTTVIDLCLVEYDAAIHEEQDNFQCSDARILESHNGSSYTMYIDTISSREELLENCEEPSLSAGQWYQLSEKDTVYNYTLFIDTSRTKIHAFTGSCGSLTCLNNFNYENIYTVSRITFTIDTGESIFFYLEQLDTTLLEPSIFFHGVPAEKGEICEDAISVVNDTTLSIDFSDAVFNFNSCTHQTEKEKWISILGDGRRVVFYQNTLSDLHIYEGTCESLECMMISRGVTEYLQTEVGKEYKVAVSDPVTFFPAQPLILDIEYFDPPINETYENAILIGCGDSISRNFDAVARGVPCLNTTKLWYELAPSESIYNIHLLPSHSVSGTIYTETENGIECESAISFRERLNVTVKGGEKKYLAISPVGTNSSFTPTFELTLSCVQPAINNEFEDAQNISCDEPVQARTNNASSSDQRCGSDYPYDNLWYKIIGSDKIYSVERIENSHNRFTLYQKSEEGNVECIGWPSVYVPGKDTLYISGSSPGYQGDTLMFKMNCTSMAINRSSDLSKSVVCGASTSLDFFDYQDSLSIPSGKIDAWYDIHPSGQVLSIHPNGGSSIEKHIYRKVNGTLEEVSYTSITHIELPDTTSEYLVQFVSTNERSTLNFAINCLQAAANGSSCTAKELSCQDTINLDGNLRVLTSPECNEPGLPKGYWYQLNGSHRGMLTSINSSIRNPIIIGKNEQGFDTVGINNGYVEMEFAYFDLEEGKEYFLVFPEGTRSQQLYYECLSNVASNSSDSPVPFTEWQSCNQERYLLTQEDSVGPGTPLCSNQINYGPDYWFEYISTPEGTVDVEIAYQYGYYHLELYNVDGSPISCVTPISSTDDYPYYTDRYVYENLVSNKKYLLKVVNQDIDLLFSICSNYECNDYSESLAHESELVMCPEVLQRVSLPAQDEEFSYSISSNSLVDSIDNKNVYFKYQSGFEKDTAILMIENYCGDTNEKTYIISESDPSFCSFADCGRKSIFIDDELLDTGLTPSYIRVKEKIQGQFNLSSQDLYLQAGEEVTLFPGTSVNDQTLLEISIEGCDE